MVRSPLRAFVLLGLAGLLLLACASPATSPTEAVPSQTPAPAGTSALASPTVAAVDAPAAAAATPTLERSAATEATPQVFSDERAHQHVQQLGGVIGSRPVGSASLDRAATYIAEQLTSYGYTVERQPFTFREFQDKGSKLRVSAPTAIDLQPRTMGYSAAGAIAGEVVAAGIGQASDFSPRTRGRIALIERGQITFREKVANATAAGAIGAIISNNQPGNFRGALGEEITIPAVSISQEDGRRLRDLLARGSVEVELAVEATTVEGKAENVIGSRPGPNGRWVVIGGHYDSVPEGPGANDNASGIATTLELARVMANASYPFGLRFIAFSAEEIGLVGSRKYVSSLSEAERKQIVAMLNLDMVGVGDRLGLGGTEQMVGLGIEQGKQQGLSVDRLGGALSRGSDHGSFMAAGIEALFFYWQEDPNYHTAEDKPEYVRPGRLTDTGQLALRVLSRLAAGERG